VTDAEIVYVRDREHWRAWLEQNHADSPSIWLAIPKGRNGTPSYEEIVEEALAYGWIDGQARSLDDTHSLMLMSPRKKGSGWSRTNQRRIERLVAEGRMTPGGQAKVDAAKADGSWTLLDAAEDGIVPDDLAAVIDMELWETFPPGIRKLALTSVYTAKRPETRARRIAAIAERMARGERPA
jgi:uncharacterized protein YdeI (YjbR/CyaY-like superfamily)